MSSGPKGDPRVLRVMRSGVLIAVVVALLVVGVGVVSAHDVTCNGKTVTHFYHGTSGSDDMTDKATSNPDAMDGLQGNDIIDGAGGDDDLCGSEDSDTITGGGGNDILMGGDQRDTLKTQSGDDCRDDSEGHISDYTHAGTVGDDVFGGGGNDCLAGDDGADAVLGDDDDDTMKDGFGLDEMWGDAGNDVVRLCADGEPNDIIHSASTTGPSSGNC